MDSDDAAVYRVSVWIREAPDGCTNKVEATRLLMNNTLQVLRRHQKKLILVLFSDISLILFFRQALDETKEYLTL